ncbi:MULTISPECIES: L-rhamnose mutarotase [Sphingobacterium]|uniref:L-rhamnose mutarotase n=1 Tax=Sphingobacterium paramultivorum TaxID=2886510 RepID=A0A7G5EA41_9SPHI|nr:MULTISPECIES: L-rhamnose mutarotase [Sphingobacterium]MBB1646438.1 L-fucose mutarotase [Sphingobacterium sp. UME9]MCS4164198.1 L-rhamnose mutarotase [Sphingobacterium sp. BIGb0116]QMV70866.1 L-rhamnose mutarotase [Sphingobacterium paramultivorum]WET71946.1 MAG: L-rhamnose mutarotase [Sphingobacterium sp.]WSO14746.1 L-rhamnose mutarotase [Sphingobacterium paramultivorum]
MKRYVMALDLVDDPQLIKEYEDYHREVWPEIKRSILDAGILQMEIYRFENRLFMNMEVGEDFSFEKKSAMDAANEKVQEWEQLMWKYQAAIPGANPGEKWVMMTKIFELV